jgi:hypothetical protein
MAKKEIKETDLVAVEMTEQEKADFVAYKLSKEKEHTDKATREEEGFVEMHLFKAHSYGRHRFGPGKARVPAGLAGQVAWIEERARHNELNLNTENKRLVEVMMNGQSVPRPVK